MRLISSALVLALSISAASAGETGLLTPGAPAGVKRAQSGSDTGVYIVVGVAAAIGIVVAASVGDGTPIQNPAPTVVTTTTTG